MKKHNVFLLSLGCSKNTVDSERLMAQAEASGIIFTEQADEADTILINTCGFIADAPAASLLTPKRNQSPKLWPPLIKKTRVLLNEFM